MTRDNYEGVDVKSMSREDLEAALTTERERTRVLKKAYENSQASRKESNANWLALSETIEQGYQGLCKLLESHQQRKTT